MLDTTQRERGMGWRQIWLRPSGGGWQLALFGLGHILIFALVFHTVYRIEYSGVGLYFEYASEVLSGSLPYRDFPLEYPPLSLFFFTPPRLLADTWQTYAVYFQGLVVIFDLIGLLVLYGMARRLGEPAWKMLAVYTLGILALGPIVGQQYDIFPAVMSLSAVYCLSVGRHKTAWALLALGTLTKIYPVVIVPVFLIYYLRQRQYQHIWSGMATFAAMSLVVLLPFLITEPSSFLSLFSYHGQRGLQLESTYSSLLLLGNQLGWLEVGTAFTYGSWNLTGPAANFLTRVSFLLLPLSLAATYGWVYLRMKAAADPRGEMASYVLLLLAVFLLANKVLSPQYLIWLCPLLPLVWGRLRYVLSAAFIAAGALTYYIFPMHYTQLIMLESGATFALCARNLLLLALLVLVAVSLARQGPNLVRYEPGGKGDR